jgi:deoxyinosine 3'endonuclease (endonuclease V)
MQELIEIQKERQQATRELSEILGVDVSFSDEEIIQFAEEKLEEYINKETERMMKRWMK